MPSLCQDQGRYGSVLDTPPPHSCMPLRLRATLSLFGQCLMVYLPGKSLNTTHLSLLCVPTKRAEKSKQKAEPRLEGGTMGSHMPRIKSHDACHCITTLPTTPTPPPTFPDHNTLLAPCLPLSCLLSSSYHLARAAPAKLPGMPIALTLTYTWFVSSGQSEAGDCAHPLNHRGCGRSN